jgi:hypothetical protein
MIGYLLHLRSQPHLDEEIRREARRTAALFTWPEVIENLLGKLEYLAMTRGVSTMPPAPAPPTPPPARPPARPAGPVERELL